MSRVTLTSCTFVSRRHVLTGSYHNYFRIFDVETLNDVVLQADKSAFKAKKIGGPLPGNKAGMKNGMRPGGLRENMALETLDFNKKILHASWHPREYTIAVSGQRMLPCSVAHEPCMTRLLRRTTSSCTAPHEHGTSFSPRPLAVALVPSNLLPALHVPAYYPHDLQCPRWRSGERRARDTETDRPKTDMAFAPAPHHDPPSRARVMRSPFTTPLPHSRPVLYIALFAVVAWRAGPIALPHNLH